MGIKNQFSDEDLLKCYEPVLRFSGGERFFPMDVEQYIQHCPRLFFKRGLWKRIKSFTTYKILKPIQIKWPYLGQLLNWLQGKILTKLNIPYKEDLQAKKIYDWNKQTNLTERINIIKSIKPNDNFYMQFIVRNFWADYVPKIILTIEVLILTIIIVLGISQLSTTYLELKMNYWDVFKIGILGLGIVAWPLIDADGKVQMAIILNFFGIFFFGKLFVVGFGLLAIAIITGFWVVFFIFKLGFSIVKSIKKKQFVSRWTIIILHAISLFFVGVSSGIVGIGLGTLIGGEPTGISFATTASTLIFYILLLINDLIKDIEGTRNNKKVVIALKKKEIRAIYCLLIVLLFIGTIYLYGTQNHIIDWTTLHVTMISLSGISLLWYALDPISVIKPGLLDQKNQRDPIIGWDGRVLAVISGILIFYLIISIMVMEFDYTRINDTLTAVGLHFFVSIINIAVTMGILGTSAISYFLDLFSGLYNTDAIKAREKYLEITQNLENRYFYYGRVCHEGSWTILQYHYFYAFNDFRSSANGMNNHEGDWETISIYLHENENTQHCNCSETENIRPVGIALSQHSQGVFRFWENMNLVLNKDLEPTCHPLVYVALGSHANYSKPKIYPLSYQFPGATQRVMAAIEKIVRRFRTRSGLVDKYKREMDENPEMGDPKIAEGAKLEGSSREFAAGDGIRIGYTPDPNYNDTKYFEKENKVSPNLPEHIKRRESQYDGVPADKELDNFGVWTQKIIDENTEWVQYGGLWGRKARIEGESGPQGPKWEKDKVRIRWGGRQPGYFLEWLHVLLLDMVHDDNLDTRWRTKALELLTSTHLHTH